MKKYILCISLLLSFFRVLAQEDFTVRVKMENFKEGTPFLAYMNNTGYVIETKYKPEGGYMVFKGTVEGPIVASFGVRNANPNVTVTSTNQAVPRFPRDFVLTNEVITIKGDAGKLNQATVTGGKFNKQYTIDKANLARLAKSRSTAAVETSNAAMVQDQELRVAFIHAHPESIISVYYLYTLSNSISFEELKAAYTALGPIHKDGVYGKMLGEKVRAMEATSTGKQAIAIDKTDLAGNPVNLASLKGKYVLLDFWGSWCGPCRASHPHLKSLYSKYKASGFEIVGIAQEQKPSLEECRIAWKKAIKEDDINWVQVLNNDGIEKSDAVKAYGVGAFPTKLLLDKEGKVVARYIGDTQEIDVALSKVFGF